MEDVEAEAGKKIANFCRDYDTYWLEDTTDERRDIQHLAGLVVEFVYSTFNVSF